MTKIQIWCAVLFLLFVPIALAQQQAGTRVEVIGEIFGVPVPLTNYYFIKSCLSVFGNRWGQQPKTAEEFEDMVWEQLVLSFDAFRRNIVVSQAELDAELLKIFQAEKVKFNYKKDKKAYKKWVEEKTKAPAELFENQVRHILQIEKLKQQVIDSAEPMVSEDEVHQEFLNERNSLSVELAGFPEYKTAEEFYKKVKENKNFWEDEKARRPNDFKRPGFVSLEFLIDIWRIPKEACYKMLKMQPGEFYSPEQIYEGYVVFKVLEARPVNEADYAKLRPSYYEQVKNRKKFDGLNDWIKQLKQQAKIKIYKQGG